MSHLKKGEKYPKDSKLTSQAPVPRIWEGAWPSPSEDFYTSCVRRLSHPLSFALNDSSVYHGLQKMVVLAGFFLILSACQKIETAFKDKTARAQYADAIREGPIAQKPIVKQWLAEGDSMLLYPVPIDLPFQSRLAYFNDEPNAWAWQVDLSEGRTLRAHISRIDTSHRVFMELYSKENGQSVLEKAARDSLISYTLDEDQTLILRVQAELLVNGSATVTLTDNPSMEFPVKGGIRADIGSFWGDTRDGGSRKHKGVDIFADRGTPVLATADGRITRTGNGGLGGKTVWLRAGAKALYYAHLDSVKTHMGADVNTGDTLGFVGNTGNARTTPPHLHFGIYDRGATNPLPYIDFANTQIKPLTVKPSAFVKWGRVASGKANVRPLPSTQKPPLTSLEHNNPVQITASTGAWYQVILPKGQKGFIYQSLLEPADSRLQKRQLSSNSLLYDTFRAHKPFLKPDSGSTIDFYGSFGNRQLAKFQKHWVWVDDE